MTTKARKRLKKPESETRLERAVRLWLNEQAENYEDGWRGAYRDLQHGGCQSGIVGSLIYYTDTVKFYRRHQKEIDALLKEMLEQTGDYPARLFGNEWDESDPLAHDTANQNLLAWFCNIPKKLPEVKP